MKLNQKDITEIMEKLQWENKFYTRMNIFQVVLSLVLVALVFLVPRYGTVWSIMSIVNVTLIGVVFVRVWGIHKKLCKIEQMLQDKASEIKESDNNE